jgi:sirohydrochlorin cobaltochelatase
MGRDNAHSRQAITRQAERLRGLREFADVRAIFLEETPRIGECYALARTRNMIVVPFFISEGMHTREDIPVLLGETQAVVRQQLAAGRPTWRNPTEKRGKLVWLSAAAGTAPEIAEIILDRVREAARTC